MTQTMSGGTHNSSEEPVDQMNTISEHQLEHQRIRKDLWEGDGRDNPSVTARLAVLEDNVKKATEKIDKITANIDRLVWIVLTTVLGVAGDIAYHTLVK